MSELLGKTSNLRYISDLLTTLKDGGQMSKKQLNQVIKTADIIQVLGKQYKNKLSLFNEKFHANKDDMTSMKK